MVGQQYPGVFRDKSLLLPEPFFSAENVVLHLPLEAGAAQERTLFLVSWTPLFGTDRTSNGQKASNSRL
jgi:hypothetical protein